MLLKRLLIYLFLATASLGSPFLLHAQEEPQAVKSKELEGTVEVSFKIDGAGKVEILNINATSPQLADYVIKKLKKIQLEKGDPQIGQVIKYRFVFKKQA
jgi:outer membrane biosynthesis protein TonB